jgi:hypothetical protein
VGIFRAIRCLGDATRQLSQETWRDSVAVSGDCDLTTGVTTTLGLLALLDGKVLVEAGVWSTKEGTKRLNVFRLGLSSAKPRKHVCIVCRLLIH